MYSQIKNRLALLCLPFIITYSCKAQSTIRDGMIASYSQNRDTLIEISYKNDTIFGEYRIKYKDVLIEEGFRNNFKVKKFEYYSYKPNSKGYQTGSTIIQYNKLSQPKDTFEMLKYDLENSLIEGLRKKYYANGKLKSRCMYAITTNKENISTTKQDSCVCYYMSGNIQNSELITPNYEVENQFYENGILQSKRYIILKESKSIYGTYDGYYPNGKLKKTESFSYVDTKKDGIEQEYNEKGTLISVSYYKEGLRSKLLVLDKSGKLKEIK